MSWETKVPPTQYGLGNLIPEPAAPATPAQDPRIAAWSKEFAEKVAARVKAAESTKILGYIRKGVEEEDTDILDRGRSRARFAIEGPHPAGSSPESLSARQYDALELLPEAIRKAFEDASVLFLEAHQLHVLGMVDLRAKQAAAEEHQRLGIEARNELTRFARERAEVFDIRLTSIMSDIEKHLTEQLRLLEQATQSGLTQIKRATDLFALEYGDGEQKSQ